MNVLLIIGFNFYNEIDVFFFEIVFFLGWIDNFLMLKCDIEYSFILEKIDSLGLEFWFIVIIFFWIVIVD